MIVIKIGGSLMGNGREIIDHLGEGVSILLPYNFLRENDELAHTWEVTSDTIAAYLAKALNAKELIKATDVDGISSDHLVREILAKDAEKVV
jgi:hypothetical protein